MMGLFDLLFGPPNVEKMKARKDVEGLIKALGYQKDVYVRKNAANALGQISDARAVEPLIAALKEQDGNEDCDVREAAAQALGRIGDPRAVEPLIAATLKDQAFHVQKAAAEALGRIGNARAVEPLIAALKDQDVWVRMSAAKALERTLERIGAPALEPLIAALKDKNGRVRKAAVEGLGRIGDARAVEPLSNTLGDRNRSVRRAAAKALGQIGNTHAVKAIITALNDEVTDVLEPLIAALNSSSLEIRKASAEALVKMYSHTALDEDAKKRILAVRGKIIRKHSDFSGDCYGPGKNVGIGVDFPL